MPIPVSPVRITDPLVIGAGPAGCATAIMLARGGASPLLIDRHADVADALCGGFLSWRTVERLAMLGVNVAALGAHPIDQVRLMTGTGTATAPLPARAWGLSRRALDTEMRRLAIAAGARFEQRTVRSIDHLSVDTDKGPITATDLFLANGKHDIRGTARPRDGEQTLGLRIVVPANAELQALLSDGIELHLFDGGYCGIQLQEDYHAGSPAGAAHTRPRANFCMAVRKSTLAESGGQPQALLDHLAARYPELGLRLELAGPAPTIDAIAAIPYGWRTAFTSAHQYRLGDQAAVIPSLAGEGIDIAISSGVAAAAAYLGGDPAASVAYQRRFNARARRPLAVAGMLWHGAETPSLARLALPLVRAVPALAGLAARLTRID